MFGMPDDGTAQGKQGTVVISVRMFGAAWIFVPEFSDGENNPGDQNSYEGVSQTGNLVYRLP